MWSTNTHSFLLMDYRFYKQAFALIIVRHRRGGHLHFWLAVEKQLSSKQRRFKIKPTFAINDASWIIWQFYNTEHDTTVSSLIFLQRNKTKL